MKRRHVHAVAAAALVWLIAAVPSTSSAQSGVPDSVAAPRDAAWPDLYRNAGPDGPVFPDASPSSSTPASGGASIEPTTYDYYVLAPTLPTPPAPIRADVVDLDADGHLDIVTANHLGSSISIYRGLGGGVFAARVDIAFQARPTWVTHGDMDNDGDTDLVVSFLNSPTSEGLVLVLLNLGDGTFEQTPYVNVGYLPTHVSLFDWDGDGLLDATTATYAPWGAESGATVLRNTGGGILERVQDVVSAPQPLSTAIDDLDGDGAVDLIVPGSYCNFASAYALGGSGFEESSQIGLQWNADYGSIVDLDADGRKDLVMCSGNGAASIFMNDGSGVFENWIDYPTLAWPVAVETGDLTHDGVLDLVTAHYASSGAAVLPGKGDGTFDPMRGYGAGLDATSVALGDVDEDGNVDVVTADYSANTVSILAGDGGGGLRGRRVYPTGSMPRATEVGDLNNDGYEDMVVAFSYTDAFGVLLGEAGGTFQPLHQYRTSGTPNGIALCDLDGDGDLDVICSDQWGFRVWVYPNAGDGTLGPPAEYAVAEEPFEIATGDLNGDGHPDLAVACHRGNAVSVLMNDGAGGLLPHVDYGYAHGPIGALIWDLDSDGDNDVIVANYEAARISLYLNTGSGQLVFWKYLDTHIGPWVMITAPLFGSGRDDLIISCRRGSKVAWFENLGGGRFNYGDVETGANPAGIATTDVDGDGDLDVVATNFNGHSLSVLENTGSGLAKVAEFPAGVYPEWLRARDVDGDGIDELIYNTGGDRVMSVLKSRLVERLAAPGSLAVAAGFAPARMIPNPVRARALIRFDLPRAGHVRARILDVAGRVCDVPVDGWMPEGRHEVAWDRASAGRPLAPGVYLCVLELDEHRSVERFVVVR